MPASAPHMISLQGNETKHKPIHIFSKNILRFNNSTWTFAGEVVADSSFTQRSQTQDQDHAQS